MPAFDNRFPGMLRSGRPCLGLFVNIPSPALVEMAGWAGFEFVVIDNEHGPAGFETTEHLIRAARCGGTLPVVRVSGTSPQEILKALDAGASGIQVPQVNSGEQAEAVVRAAKYPPRGGRGAAFSTRAGGYSLYGGPAHMGRSDDGTVVVIQVETVEAVANLDAILAVRGIDVVFIGPTDLSTSMGYPGNPGHPEVAAAINDCVRRISAAGSVPGLMVADGDAYRLWAGRSARYLTMNGAGIVAQALRTAAGARGAAADAPERG